MHQDAQSEPAASPVVAALLARVRALETQRPRRQRGATDGWPPAPRGTHTRRGFEFAPLARAEQTSRRGAAEEFVADPGLADFLAGMGADPRLPPDFPNDRTPRDVRPRAEGLRFGEEEPRRPREDEDRRRGRDDEPALAAAARLFAKELRRGREEPEDDLPGSTRHGIMSAVRGRMDNAPRARARGRVHGSTTRFER